MLRDVDVSEAVTVVEDAATVMVLGVTPRHEQANGRRTRRPACSRARWSTTSF